MGSPQGESFTATFDIRSLWIFPIYFGSVRVTDTQGSVITVPVWFGSAQATAEGATGSANFLGALDIDWTVADLNPDQIDITIGGTQEFSGSGTATSGDITVTKSGARLTRVAGTATVATTGSSGISYSYDGDGNRLSATDNADPTNDRRFAWDTHNPVPQLATETTGSDTALRTYTYGQGLVATETPNDILYAHTDVLGSVTHLSDAEGTETGTFTYEPYGTPTTTGAAADHPIGFTGQYADAAGYYNLRARTYDPETGSFLTPDPLEAPESTTTTTPYTYVENQPTTHTDPTGMRGMPPGGAVFADLDNRLAPPRQFGVCDIRAISEYSGGDDWRSKATFGEQARALYTQGQGGVSWESGCSTLFASSTGWAFLEPLTAIPSLAKTGGKAAVRGSLAGFAGVVSLFPLFLCSDQANSHACNNNDDDKKAVVIGETMTRVRAAAAELDAETYEGPPDLRLNRSWIRDAKSDRRTVYDIGIDASRRTRSDFYAMESDEVRDYPLRRPIHWP